MGKPPIAFRPGSLASQRLAASNSTSSEITRHSSKMDSSLGFSCTCVVATIFPPGSDQTFVWTNRSRSLRIPASLLALNGRPPLEEGRAHNSHQLYLLPGELYVFLLPFHMS